MPDAGVIQSEIRINFTKLNNDFKNIQTAFKSGSANLAQYTSTFNQSMDAIATKTNSTLSKNVGVLKSIRDGLVRLAQQAQNHSLYDAEIEKLNQLITKSEEYVTKHTANLQKKKEAEKQAAKVTKEQAKANEQAEKSQNSLTKAIIGGNIATRLLFAAIRLIKKGLSEMVRISMEYEQSLANTQSVAQATAQELRELDRAARKAGETTRYTASQAAEAMYFMASAGYSATESVQSLDGVLAMAQATWSDLGQTAEIVAVTLAQFNLKATETMRVANAMTAGITSSQATMDKYKTSLYQVGPVASGVGQSLEQTLGILNAMYDAGMQASRAGRAMRNALAELSNENSKTVKRLEELGIAFEDIDVSQHSLVDVFGTLNQAGLDSGQIMNAFGKVIGPQMQILIRSSRDELQKYVDDVTDTNKALTAAHVQNDTLQGDWFRLKSASEALAITIGKGLMPLFRGFVQVATSLVRGINYIIKAMTGAETVADDLYTTYRNLSSQADEYGRLTSILKTDTDKLTESERQLYELRLEQIKLSMLTSLDTMSSTYQKTLKYENDLAKAYKYTNSTYAQGLKAREVYNRIASARDKLAKGELITEEERNKLWTDYVHLIRDADQLERDYVSLQAQGLDVEAIKAIEAARSMFQSFKIADAQFWDESAENLDDVLRKMIKNTPTYIGVILNNLAELNVETQTSLIAAKSNITETINQAGRLLAVNAITEEMLEGLDAQLVQSIRDAADKYSELSTKTTQATESEYENISAIEKQIDTSGKATDAINEFINSQIDASAQNLIGTKGLKEINDGYAILKEQAEKAGEALKKQAEEQYDVNLETIANAEALSAQASAELEARAEKLYNLELSRIQFLTDQKLITLERERLALIGETTSVELQALEQRKAEYLKLEGTFTNYAQKIVDFNRKMREEGAETAYKDAWSNEDIEVALSERTKLFEEQKQEELDALQEAFNVQVALTRETVAKQIEEEKTAYAASEQAFRNMEASKIAEIEANANEELLALKAVEAEKIAERKRTYNTDINLIRDKVAKGVLTEASGLSQMKILAQRYDKDVAAISSERVAFEEGIARDKLEVTEQIDAMILALYEDSLKKREGITKEGDAAIEQLETEHAATLADLLQYFLVTYKDVLDEAEKATKEKNEKIREGVEDTISGVLNVVNAIESAISESYNRRIEAVDALLEAELKAIEERERAELESLGLLEETELEKYERAVIEAKKAADTEKILEAQKELERFKIQEKYREETEQAEKDATNERIRIEYEAALISWQLTLGKIIAESALAMMKAISTTVGNPFAAAIIGLTTAASMTQIAAHASAKPQPPTYLASGGIIRGTASGTAIIAGEKYRTETVFNPDQMANLLMAIAQGRTVQSEIMNVTFIMKDVNSKEQAKYTVELINNGQYIIDPKRGIKKERA